MAQTATKTFPTSKIIISTLLPRRDIHPATLLPRRDIHPATIQRVNAEITRACASMANVHLAH
ncbi:MAG: hypothetical protein ACRC6N_07215, partial [Plesiomonas sp.]|uniref:hypothetical protein n=1 Tax=Plesiomonas sp. TaxID=2486279 RepID=UPI003F39ACE9